MTVNRPAYHRATATAVFREQSVGDMLRETAGRVPDRLALIVPASGVIAERSWTYGALLLEATELAHALLSRFAPGDRVATWVGGSAEMVLLEFGAALAGITLVTINPANRTVELEHALLTSRARGLFLDRQFRGFDNEAVIDALRGAVPALETLIYTDAWGAFQKGLLPCVEHEPLPPVLPDHPALILFTSGSSGKPKPAVLHHAGIVNNAALTAAHLGMEEASIWLNVLPMFHVGGTVTMTLGCLSVAGTQILLPVFAPDTMLDALARYRVNMTMAVPTMLVSLLESPVLEQSELSALALIVAGGSAVAPDLVRRVKAAIGAEIASLMGQTEASGAMFATRRGDDEDRVTMTVGTALALSEVRIADPVTGDTRNIGEPGEICIRAPSVMSGYLDLPDRTAATIDKDGWLHTGDIGAMRPDHYIKVTGRMSDMIIRGGENIYPREVENVLVSHPTVGQAAVYGVPDARWGEQVAAALVPRAGEMIDTLALGEWLTTRIAHHRVPKIWRVLDALPVNASGKVQKFVLQSEHRDSAS